MTLVVIVKCVDGLVLAADSKQTLAKPVGKHNVASTLFDALVFLRQHPAAELRLCTVEEILAWAKASWDPDSLLNVRELRFE